MKRVTCSACSAAFEVDFEPGTEFTCGACGAVVAVPAAPAPPPRVAPVARPRPQASAARRAPAERAPAPPKPPGKQKVVMWAAIGGTVLVLAVLGIIALTKGDSETEQRPSTTPQAVDNPKETPSETPKTVTEASAPTQPTEAPRVPKVRPSDPLGAARFDAQEPGAGSLKQIAFADLAYDRADQLESEGKRDEAAALRKEALATYTEVIMTEKNHERARERLGYVKYDPVEAKRLAGLQYLSQKLRNNLGEAIEQVEEKTKGRQVAWPLWMNVKSGGFEDIAADWRKALRDAKELETLEKEKLTDPFYDRAKRMAAAVEGDVGPVLKRKRLEGPAFDVFPRKPFVLLIHRDANYDTAEVAGRWAELLLQLRETFIARFRTLNLPLMDRPTPLLLLRYDTDYTKYLRRGDEKGGRATPTTSIAHFEPFSKRLVTWKDPDPEGFKKEPVSEESVRTTLFHEGTHQLVDYYTKTRVTNLDESLWFSEGIADYFGGHGRKWDEEAGKWRYEPGLINTERVQGVGDAKAGNYLFKIRDLLAYRRGDYERDKEAERAKTGTAYAQGWALVYFLSEWQDRKYREKFDEYVKKEMNGESGVAAFESVFGAGSIDQIEKELHEMIDVLHKALKDKKIVNGKLLK